MRKTLLPGTDLTSSSIGLGTWGLGGANDVDGVSFGWPEVPRRVARRVIEIAYEHGITFFDCSDFYGRGRSEELLGEVLPNLKGDVIVATKVGLIPRLRPGSADLDRNFSPEYLERALDASLRRLRREAVDLYQLHGPGPDVLERDETWRSLEQLKAAGKIRYVGVSLKASQSRGDALERWLAFPRLATVQLQYSLSEPECARDLDRLGNRGKAVIARSIFGHGLLLREPNAAGSFAALDHRRHKWNRRWSEGVATFKAAQRRMSWSRSLLEVALRYALDSPTVSLTLAGATTPAQILAVIAACRGSPLRPHERNAVSEAAFAAFGTANVG